jgi:hypothetical protein
VLELFVLVALIPVGVFIAAAPVLLGFWAVGAVSAWLAR